MIVALAASSVARADDPSTPVREAYRVERESLAGRGPSKPGPPWTAPHRERLFSKRFAALWAREERYREATHEIGNTDHDPFIAAQDYSDDVLHDLDVAVVTRGPGGAVVRARFTNMRRLVIVRFSVLHEGGRWVIDDIVDTLDGVEYSTAEALSEPLWCTEGWNEPCRSSAPPCEAGPASR